jgi:hypothetical protein
VIAMAYIEDNVSRWWIHLILGIMLALRLRRLKRHLVGAA